MSYGDGTGWDESLPTDSTLISNVPKAIREVNLAHTLRTEKEHNTLSTSTGGGEHKEGSARAYHQSSYPTKQPDGSTDLAAGDAGRLMVDSDDGRMNYWDGTAWQSVKITALEQVADGLLDKTKVATGFTNGIYPYTKYSDAKSDGTDGGTFTSGAWRTRTLNTEDNDAGDIGSVSSNQITLDAGTYRIRASAPAHQVAAHQARWRDVTNGTTKVLGTTEQAPSGTAVQTRSWVEGEFTVADDDTVFELQHICATTKSGSGLGLNCNLGTGEVYSVVEIWKLL